MESKKSNSSKKEEFPSQTQDEIKKEKSEKQDVAPESSGSEEDSYKAATRGTEIEVHQPHPTKIPHPRDEISR